MRATHACQRRARNGKCSDTQQSDLPKRGSDAPRPAGPTRAQHKNPQHRHPRRAAVRRRPARARVRVPPSRQRQTASLHQLTRPPLGLPLAPARHHHSQRLHTPAHRHAAYHPTPPANHRRYKSLHHIKGGSLRSPPPPAAGGRKRPSSPARQLGHDHQDVEEHPRRLGSGARTASFAAPATVKPTASRLAALGPDGLALTAPGPLRSRGRVRGLAPSWASMVAPPPMAHQWHTGHGERPEPRRRPPALFGSTPSIWAANRYRRRTLGTLIRKRSVVRVHHRPLASCARLLEAKPAGA